MKEEGKSKKGKKGEEGREGEGPGGDRQVKDEKNDDEAVWEMKDGENKGGKGEASNSDDWSSDEPVDFLGLNIAL